MLHKVIWKIYEIYFTSETKGTINYPDRTTQSNAFLTCGFTYSYIFIYSFTYLFQV